jgi:hypothetical protein
MKLKQRERRRRGQHGKRDGRERMLGLKLHMPNNRVNETMPPMRQRRHEKLERHRKQPKRASSKNVTEDMNRLPGLELPLLKREQQERRLQPSCAVVKLRKMKRIVRPLKKQQQRRQQRHATESKQQRLTDRWQPTRLKVGWLLSLRRLGLES